MDARKEQYYEILAAVDVCKQKNFSRQSVREALLLIKAYRDGSSDREEAQKLARLAVMLAEKMEERERLAEQWRTRGADDAYSRLFPLIPPEKLKVLPIGNASVLEANKIYRDNTQLLIGPFESELVAQTRFYAKNGGAAYRLVDCAAIARDHAEKAEELFASLGACVGNAAAQEIVVYSGVDALCAHTDAAGAFCRYLRSNRLNKPNIQQFVLCVSPSHSFNDIYTASIGAAEGSEEIADSPLPVLYLPLPSFKTVKEHIFRRYPGAPAGAEGILKRTGYLLGYEGLCELLAPDDPDWPVRLGAISERKKQDFEKFARSVSFNLERVLDKEWDYRIEEAPPIEIGGDDPVWNPVFHVPATLYDSVDGLDEIRRNVVKIVERKDMPIRVRCGWVVSYALTNGDILNVLNVDEAQLEAVLKGRWSIAYAALTQLMRIPYGELLFDIGEGSGLLGLCCDGGKTIRMNGKYIRTQDRKVLGDGCNTMLHELFHALQHTGMAARERQDTDMLGYQLTHFRVSGHRIREWAENNKRYRSQDKNFDDYYDQIMEADARIFASEILSEFGQMNIPDLDE